MAQLKGADLSHYQSPVNFDQLKGQLDFVILKATEGVGVVDTAYSGFLSESRRVGLLIGHYHFAHPELNSAKAEALYFLKVAKVNPGEILCLDYEAGTKYADPVGWSLQFLQAISTQLGGYSPLIYLNKSTVSGFDWSPVVANNNGLWLADFNNDPVNTNFKSKWPVIAMRQYWNQGTLQGVTGQVDLDTFYGDSHIFQAYGIKAPPVAPDDLQRILDHFGVKNADEMIQTQDQQLQYLKDARAQVSSLQIQLGDAQGATAAAQNALKQSVDALSQAKSDGDLVWTTLLKGSTTIVRDDMPSLAAFLTKAQQDEDTLLTLQKTYEAEVQQHKADLVVQSERLDALQVQLNGLKAENDALKEQAGKLGSTTPQTSFLDTLVAWVKAHLQKGVR